MNTGYLHEKGKEQVLSLGFITADNNEMLESSPIDTTLSEEEIAALERPIYMPYTMQDTIGYISEIPSIWSTVHENFPLLLQVFMKLCCLVLSVTVNIPKGYTQSNPKLIKQTCSIAYYSSKKQVYFLRFHIN